MIGLTTGRETNQRLNSLLKELAHSIPRAKVVRRGKSGQYELGRRFFAEGLDYALILQRWHGGPGRMEFFEVKGDALTQIVPVVMLGGVKLRREYGNRGNSTAQAIAQSSNVSENTKRFTQHLSRFLDLPETSRPTRPEIRTTFHVSEGADGSIVLVLTSPPGEREVGPRLVISKLVWNLDA